MEEIHSYLKALFKKGGFSTQQATEIADEAIQTQTSAAFIHLSNKEPKELRAMTKALATPKKESK